MRPPITTSVRFTKDDEGRNARRHGRIRCEMLQCHLGKVMDLSASGIRVHRRGRRVVNQDDKLCLTLESINLTLSLKARVAWVAKKGFLNYEFGMEFLEMTPETAASIASLARLVIENRVIAQSENVW